VIIQSRVVSALVIASALLVAPLLVAQVQIPEDHRSDLLVKTRSIEQPQLSQYAVELPTGNPLTMLPVAGNIFMIAGSGTSNVSVQVGEDGVVLVDSGAPDFADVIQQAVRAVSKRPVNFVLMTGSNPDHFANNGKMSLPPFGWPPNQAPQGIGGPVENTLQPAIPPAGGGGGRGGINQVNSATIVGHENTLNRMSAPTGQASAFPFELWPTSTFFTPKKTIFWNGEPIELISEAGATTDGDVMVFFRRSDVISTGDIIDANGYPRIDVKRGGSIQGTLEALNDIIEITVPAFNQQGGTKIVPGHGRIYQEHDAVMYRDMVTIIHDRVKLGIEKKMTLAQIKAQRPTLDYDGLYSKPDWTGEMFVDAIYAGLTAPSAR
jgi:glyoxylase-like metal-dependent hydrolase (beta-lactamase superfamily II)